MIMKKVVSAVSAIALVSWGLALAVATDSSEGEAANLTGGGSYCCRTVSTCIPCKPIAGGGSYGTNQSLPRYICVIGAQQVLAACTYGTPKNCGQKQNYTSSDCTGTGTPSGTDYQPQAASNPNSNCNGQQ